MKYLAKRSTLSLLDNSRRSISFQYLDDSRRSIIYTQFLNFISNNNNIKTRRSRSSYRLLQYLENIDDFSKQDNFEFLNNFVFKCFKSPSSTNKRTILFIVKNY